MYRIKVHLVGKSKEQWLQEAEKEYLKRVSPTIQVEVVLHRDQQKLEDALIERINLILLDPIGTQYDIIELAKVFEELLYQGGSRLEIAIGGPEGFSASFRHRFPKISFSRLTFTHQMCRLILWEQLYRSTEIWKGSEYHK